MSYLIPDAAAEAARDVMRSHGAMPATGRTGPRQERVRSFAELSTALLPEYQLAAERCHEIDEEVARCEDARLRARQARADAQFARVATMSVDAAAESYLRGEDAPVPTYSGPVVQAPSEEVVLGLGRKIESLQRERGALVARVKAVRRELVVAMAHDAADRYRAAADDLMAQFALLTEAGQIAGEQTLGLAAPRMLVPGLGDKFRHGAHETMGCLHSQDDYRASGGFQRARDTIGDALRDFRALD